MPSFMKIIKDELKCYDISENTISYYIHAIEYNVEGGKLLRGTLLVATVYSTLKGKVNDTVWQQALTLGWCVELLQASFLVADDIMDEGVTRRSKPCWYLVDTIGIPNALTDSFFLLVLVNRSGRCLDFYWGCVV